MEAFSLQYLILCDLKIINFVFFFFAFYSKLFEILFWTDAMSSGKITFEGNSWKLHFKKYSQNLPKNTFHKW